MEQRRHIGKLEDNSCVQGRLHICLAAFVFEIATVF